MPTPGLPGTHFLGDQEVKILNVSLGAGAPTLGLSGSSALVA